MKANLLPPPAVKFVKTLRKFPKSRRSAIVIPPAGDGSLGDAAMMVSSYAVLKRMGYDRVGLMHQTDWSAISVFDAFVPARSFFYGGSRRPLPAILATLLRYDHCYFIGADVLDGVYNPASVLRRLKVLSLFAECGLGATILGSSFSEHSDPGCVDFLRAMNPNVVINARDPISQARMERLLDRPIRGTADLAFLLPYEEDFPAAQETRSWITAQESEGRPVVALNANFLLSEKNPGYDDANRALALALLEQGMSLLLVPHDVRKNKSDMTLLDHLKDSLPAEYQPHLLLMFPDDPRTIKSCVAACRLAITGRMHLAILAMGAGTPALSFGYQGKFEGLYQILGLKDQALLHSVSDLISDPAGIAGHAVRAIERGDQLRAILGDTYPQIRKLAEQNFV